MNSKYYIALKDADDALLVGGKAKMLGTLIRKGLNIPDGWVITTQLLYWLFELCGLKRTEVDEALQDTEKAQILRDVLKTAKWPKEVYDVLWEIFTLLKPPLCVRSSAVNEDGANESLAGVYRSNINVRTFGEFLWAVRDCMLSAFDEHAILYTQRVKKPLSMMAVVIQPLVNSAISGVAIIEKGSLCVTAAYGLGLGVVSGGSSADIFRWDSRGGQVKQSIRNKETAYFPNYENRTTYKDMIEPEFVDNVFFKANTIEYDKRQAYFKCRINSTKNYDFVKEPVLNEFLQNKLKAFLYDLYENHLGCNDWDIEWSISPKGEIFLLQVRPLVPRNNTEDQTIISGGNKNIIFKGVPISSGLGSGPLKIIRSEADLIKIQQGDIAYMGWIPDNFINVLCKVSALVIVNAWGMSHCAILAREWQIPCVGGVTEQIFTEGKSYIINGSTGEISIFKSNEETEGKRYSKENDNQSSFIVLPWFIHAISEIYARPDRRIRYLTHFRSIISDLEYGGIIDFRNILINTGKESEAFYDTLHDFIAQLISIAVSNGKTRFIFTQEEFKTLKKILIDYEIDSDTLTERSEIIGL